MSTDVPDSEENQSGWRIRLTIGVVTLLVIVCLLLPSGSSGVQVRPVSQDRIEILLSRASRRGDHFAQALISLSMILPP